MDLEELREEIEEVINRFLSKTLDPVELCYKPWSHAPTKEQPCFCGAGDVREQSDLVNEIMFEIEYYYNQGNS